MAFVKLDCIEEQTVELAMLHSGCIPIVSTRGMETDFAYVSL